MAEIYVYDGESKRKILTDKHIDMSSGVISENNLPDAMANAKTFAEKVELTGEAKGFDLNKNTAYFDEVANTTTTIDWTKGNKQAKTMGASETFTFVDPPGQANLLLKLTQGVAEYSATWPGNVLWADGIEPDMSTAGSVRIVMFYFDGSVYYGTHTGVMS